MATIATRTSPITLRVYWDTQDQTNAGWAYRWHDGLPAQVSSGDAPLVESGPITGRQTKTRPSRARVLRSAGVAGSRHVHLVYAD